MSYAFDVMSRVWEKHIKPHVPDSEIVMRFEMLMETLHDANHEVAYGVFKGDGLNKHPRVTADARKLDELDTKLKGPAKVRIAESAASEGEKIAAQTGIDIEIVPDEDEETP